MRYTLGFFSIFAIVVAGLLLIARWFAPDQIQGDQEQARLVYLLLFLVLLGGGVFGASRADITLALRQAIIWIAIFFVVIAAFSFRDEFSAFSDRVLGELRPGQPVTVTTNQSSSAASTIAIRKSPDGHFRANAKVNNTHVRFLVDTGASIIALTLNDAKRVGIDVNGLSYIAKMNTASGITYGAPIVLEKVSVGQITLRNVQAVVLKDGLDNSLLGMSFLGRLQKFEASRNQLILKK